MAEKRGEREIALDDYGFMAGPGRAEEARRAYGSLLRRASPSLASFA